ncbi:unnamed protein product [Knipowitschia caucasica]
MPKLQIQILPQSELGWKPVLNALHIPLCSHTAQPPKHIGVNINGRDFISKTEYWSKVFTVWTTPSFIPK